MKVSKVVKICKDSGSFEVVKDNGEIWLGNGQSFYKLDEVFELTENMICTLFDISDKKRNETFIKEIITDEIPEMCVLFKDQVPGDVMPERGEVEIKYKGESFIPYKAAGETLLLNAKYFEPFKNSDDIEVWLRRTEVRSGDRVFILKLGMFNVGVVSLRRDNDEILNAVKEIGGGMND